jgi:hypothetical protein
MFFTPNRFEMPTLRAPQTQAVRRDGTQALLDFRYEISAEFNIELAEKARSSLLYTSAEGGRFSLDD